MTTYPEYRAFATSDYWLDKRDAARSREGVINNTGNSRQVRRQRERQFEDASLSASLLAKIANKFPGQGLFMQGRSRWAGWPNERRTPRADYSKRYSALFSLPSGSTGI